MASKFLHRLAPFFAVVTLPVGILAALFVGLPVAVAVFVVGWLLLVPATAILFPPEMVTGPGVPEDIDEMVEEEIRQSLGESRSEGERFDPIEELRQRYARGEIDEMELERGLEALLETEGVDADDEEQIEKTIDRLEGEGLDRRTGDPDGGESPRRADNPERASPAEGVDESDLLTEDS